MAGGNDDKGKTISINAFIHSLKDLVKSYIKTNPVGKTVEYIEKIVSELSPLVSSAWEIVAIKWEECFYVSKPSKHNKLFNIQKGIGVYQSINCYGNV